jgi:hypothetical protein
MPKALGVIQPVSDQELVWCVESHELRLVLELFGDVLVQQSTDGE